MGAFLCINNALALPLQRSFEGTLLLVSHLQFDPPCLQLVFVLPAHSQMIPRAITLFAKEKKVTETKCSSSSSSVHTHVTRLCCPRGKLGSTGLRPVKSSKRMTPKL